MRGLFIAIVKRFAHTNWALADQIMISAFNFVVSFLMIKFWTPEEFGTYTFVFAIALFATGLQNALITTQMSVLRVRFGAEREQELIDCLWTANILLIVALIVIFLAIISFTSDFSSAQYLALMLLFISTYMLKEYVRGYLFSTLLVKRVFLADMSQVILAVSSGTIAYFIEIPLTINLVIFLLSFSFLLPAIWLLAKDKEFSFSFRKLSKLKIYPEVWRGSKWSLLGVITTELQNRSYLYIVTILYGTAALALLQAGRILFVPIGLIVTAWGRVARVQLAKHFVSDQSSMAIRVLVFSGWLLGLVALVIFGIVWFFWPLIDNFLFVDKYPNIGLVVVLWAIVTFIGVLRGTSSIGLQAMNEFKRLSFTTVAGAIIALLTLTVLVQFADYRKVLLSVIFGEITALLLIIWCIHRVLNEKTRSGMEG